MAADNIFNDVLDRVRAVNARLSASGVLPAAIDQSRVVVELPRDSTHGDMATNAAMVLAKEAGKAPRELAQAIADELKAEELIERVDVAGPGFINLTLKSAAWTEALRAAIRAGAHYGRSDIGRAKRVNVEYVSANPTGPMHVGHTRGAVFGDALANLLAFTGFTVRREYYTNDAGAQVDVLARSAYLRYREALGDEIGAIPEGLYPGDYLKPVGQALAKEYGRALNQKPESEWLPIVRDKAIKMMMAVIRKDLRALGVKHEKFFSERSLVEGQKTRSTWTADLLEAVAEARNAHPQLSVAKLLPVIQSQGFTIKRTKLGEIVKHFKHRNRVAVTITKLQAKGLVYEGRLPPPKGAPIEDWEDREQTLFRATAFGDDVDRPLKKSDGTYTYFAADIAYHKSKWDRGFHNMIDVWGADHGGYIKRMAAAVQAISDGKAALDVKIVQLVRLLRNGEPVKMSKRSGEFVTLREVVDEVKRDAVRFMMLYRKNDATLDFDLAKVIEQSRDNPVFYVQYGHARGQAIFRNARAVLPDLPAEARLRAERLAAGPIERLTDPDDMALIRKIAIYPRLVEAAALAHEPHRIAFYLYDLASEFHALYTKGNDLPHLRFIIQNDPTMTAARLALVEGVVTVLASGLMLLGVDAPDEMR